VVWLARKQFSCDFETTTTLDDCRVWSWGYREIGNEKVFRYGTTIEGFMEWVSTVNADIYFHNLKFDGSFIVNWLLHNGFTWCKHAKEQGTFNTIISKMGQWYQIDICYGWKGRKKIHTVIRDSLKKLPFPVKKIAEDFKLPIKKGDIDYHKKRPVGYELEDEEIEYLHNDVDIVARALEIQFSQGLTKMTNGSDSLNNFKSTIGKEVFKHHFPILSDELDDKVRKFYKGGFTWINKKFAGKILQRGIVFDVNSLYPSVMYNRPLPFGVPVYYEGQYKPDDTHPLYLQHIRCSFTIKEGHIPTIQLKQNGFFAENEYLESSKWEIVDLYLTNVDLELFIEHYNLYDVEYVEGWKFQSKVGLFKQFIDYWTFIKITSTGAIKLLAKLMLNSLYGKFATNPDVTGKIPYLKEDGSCGFSLGEPERREPVYTPMGAFITSWARYETITTAQKCYDRIIYCDTDSIHLTGTETPEVIKDIVDPDKLGFWKFEYEFKRGKYIRQKTYYNEIEKEDRCLKKVVCAGMTEKIRPKVNMNNFEVGFTSFGKLLPKQVKGGVVLVDTEFTIK
jgi:hypothetical protein